MQRHYGWASFFGALGLVVGNAWNVFAGSPVTEAGWNDQLFPSFIIATATLKLPEEAVADQKADEHVLGDVQGLFAASVEATGADIPVKVTVTSDTIMEPSTFTGTLANEGETYRILPKIKYKYDALAKRTQSEPITVTFRIEQGSGPAIEESKTLTLRSINDCPFTIVEGEESLDIRFMFSAYVNEQHPFVDKLLREALDLGIVTSFTGYQEGSQEAVYRQVYAVWHALSQRDLRYSNITTSSANADSVYSQHVRLIDESINNAQANCVDGSVLIASVLRKIGIEPVLVMVPGHCFLGFYLDAEGKELVTLETTALGVDGVTEPVEIAGVETVVDDAWTQEVSWATFTNALQVGAARMEAEHEAFEKREDPQYQIVSVLAARRIGILPIAFQANHEFESTTTRPVSRDRSGTSSDEVDATEEESSDDASTSESESTEEMEVVVEVDGVEDDSADVGASDDDAEDDSDEESDDAEDDN